MKRLLLSIIIIFPFAGFSQFDPSSIPGMQLWLKADAGITFSTDTFVSNWADQSLNGYDAIQNSGGIQPSLVSNVLNGKPVLHFDGSDDYIVSNITGSYSDPITIFMVWTAGINGESYPFSAPYSSPPDVPVHTLQFYGSQSKISMTLGGAPMYTHASPFTIIGTYIWNGSSSELYENGISQGTGTVGAVLFTGNFSIGSVIINGIILYGHFNGEIAEIIVYNQALSITDRQNVELYLANKYGGKVDLGADININYGFCDTILDAGSQFATYSWSTGDSTQTISVSQSGSYSVTVIDALFGFTSTDIINVTYPSVNLPDTAYFCSGDSVLLSTGLGGGYTYQWSSGQTTQTIYAKTPGQYWVTVTDASLCPMISDTAVVIEDSFALAASLGNDTTLCSGNSIALLYPDPLPPGLTYLWNGGDTTPSIVIPPGGSGTYYVTVTDLNGCSATDDIYVFVSGTAPTPGFTYVSACAGQLTQFTNTSSDPNDSWLWDFGDGDTSILEDPTHPYSSGGTYNVSLEVGYGGCTNTIVLPVYIPSNPIAAFSADTACAGYDFNFTDESDSVEGNIISWYWDFGDGFHSHAKDTLHTFSSTGTYNVSLTVQTDSGCSDTVIHPISVVFTASAPAAFTLYLPCDSFITSDNIINFVWNEAIGASYYILEYSTDPLFSVSTSSSNIYSTTYQATISNPDMYYWRVIAYGLCGDATVSYTLCFIIISSSTIPGAQLWLMADAGITFSTDTFVSSWSDQTSNGYNAIQFTTDLQPSLVSNVLNGKPVLHFDGTDDYLLSNIAATYSDPITIFMVWTAGINGESYPFSAPYSSPPDVPVHTLQFYGSQSKISMTLGGAPMYTHASPFTIIGTYIWNGSSSELYENGISQGTGTVGAVLFTGNFSIGSVIINGIILYGHFNGDIAEIIIFNQVLSNTNRQFIEKYLDHKYGAIVNLGPDIYTTNFCPDTLEAGDPFIHYVWSTGNIEDTLHYLSVNTGGTYSVTATDIFGYTSVDEIVVNKPIINAYSDTLCFGDSTTLYVGLGAPYTFLWEPDSSTADSMVIHAGDIVMLHVYDTIGCSVDRQIIMSVDSFPTLDLLGSSNLNACTEDLIYPLCDTSDIETYDWYDGTSHTYNEYYTVTQIAGFTLTLTVTNARGCTATDIIPVSIQGQQPDVGFTFSSVCFPGPTNTGFDDTSTAVSGNLWYWVWDYGNGDIDTLYTSNLFNYQYYTSAGIYDVTLTVMTNQLCSKSITQQVPVYSVPVPAFSPLLGCTGIPLILTDHSISPVGDVDTWSWNFNDQYTPVIDTSTLPQPSHIYDSSGYYTIHMVVSTEYGCIDSADINIFIRPSPYVDFSYTSVCDGNPVYFTNEASDPLGIYQMYWIFNTEDTISIYNPVYTFDAGTYPVILVVQSINGCTVHDTQYVVVHAIPNAQFNPPDTICATYPYIFAESSTVLAPDIIAQWEWDFDAFGIYYGQNPVIAFAAEGDYPVQLTVTSDAGCSGSTNAVVHVNPIPAASFLPSDYYGMPPFTVTFDNTSVDALNSYWEFGDGDISTLTEPQHTYTTEDTFTVMLVVTNSALCTDTAYQEMYVIPTTADVAVKNVTTEKQGDFLKVSADIWNYGTRKIYALYLYAKASGGTMFMETWLDFVNPLQVGNFIPYTFNAQFAVPEEQSLDYICVEAQIQNYIPDDIPENNEECVTFNNNFSAFIPYPIPSNDEINIDFILPFKDQVTIDLYDVEGRLLENIFSGEANKGLNKLTVNISELALAVYVYRITFNEDFRILRFVKY